MAKPDEAPSVEPTENGEVQATDYDNMSVDELEDAFRRGEGIIEQSEPPVADDPLAPFKAKEPEVEQEEVAEPEQPEQQAEAEETPPVEEPPAEPDLPDEAELHAQELKLQLERIRQEREQFETIAGRHAGEVGFLKKELERLRAQPAPQANDDLDYPPAESPRVQPQPQNAPSGLEGQVAELLESQKASVVEKVYSEFLNQIKSDLTAQGVEQDKLDAEQNAIMEQISPTLKQRFEPFGDVSTLGTKATEKVTRMVLQGAYTDAKLAKIAALRQQAAERKATQVAENKIIKQAASPSGSGGRSVKEPPPKSIEDMTAEEADAALIELYGDGGSLR